MNLLLQELVTRQVERHPDVAAVVVDGVATSREDLENRSNQLARVLREHGCRRGDRVCVLSPSTPVAIMAMLAAFKADAIYVPLDLTTSAARLAEAVRSCQPACLLTTTSGARAVDGLFNAGAAGQSMLVGALESDPIVGEAFVTSFSMTDATQVSSRAVASRNRAGNPAYLVFPQGSGLPGVVCTHASIVRFLTWATEYFGVGLGDRHPLHSPLAQDWSVYQTVGALAGGATLCAAPEESGSHAHRLATFIRRSRLTQWCSSSEVLQTLAAADVVGPGDFPTLRHVIWWGGEVGASALQYWRTRLGHVQFTALFGARETTMASAYYTVRHGQSDGAARLPVGTPCPGHEVLLLDAGHRPVCVGEIGEIHVRGTGLSPGYWRDPEATMRAFHEQPDGFGAGDRMFQTGMSGRRGGDGHIYPIDQVKEQTS